MTPRAADHPIEPIFLDRWSPRAFDGRCMPKADLLTILEAARWAPSAYNAQPWRFVYARRDDPEWAAFVEMLIPFNASWARHAAALLFVLSDTRYDRGDGESRPAPTHSFDAGAAWAQLALQATRMGYHAHAMAGIDVERARRGLEVPPRFAIHIAVALGRAADPGRLPAALRDREQPSLRRPLEELAFAGRFPR